VAQSPLVVLGAQAFCGNPAAASFDRAYGYSRCVGGVAIVLPRSNVVLVAQAEPCGLATTSFDAAGPHYPRFVAWFVGCISIAAASLLVVFTAEAFCLNLAAASFDCAYGYRSVGGIAIVAAGPLVMLGTQTFTVRLGSASFDVTLTAFRHAQAAAGGYTAASQTVG
jgi:hypothetical protein